MTMRSWILCGWIAAAASAATVIPGNSRRGEELFQSQGCVQCHSINGKGGTAAPDLGKRIDRNFTPTSLASTMWNHAPTMWAAMRRQGIEKPAISPESAADLFAFFYSTRFFEKPGDAGRGKRLFTARHCSECHGITTSNAEGAKPVSQWNSLGHPIVLVEQMWDHAAEMQQAFARRNIPWQQLTSQELTDILVYLRNLPETRNLSTEFFYESGSDGQALFQAKCARCHTGKLALENRLRNVTLTDIAVAMWNHAPRMQPNPPKLEAGEMRRIISYVWTSQFLRAEGSASRGKQVFTEKNCATCHNDASSGAPNLAAQKSSYSPVTMISVLWDHGPRMFERMRERSLAWPRFDTREMADLIAYLNSLQ